jgi:hypothetical protein
MEQPVDRAARAVAEHRDTSLEILEGADGTLMSYCGRCQIIKRI